jgi:hypothetical protein
LLACQKLPVGVVAGLSPVELTTARIAAAKEQIVCMVLSRHGVTGSYDGAYLGHLGRGMRGGGTALGRP